MEAQKKPKLTEAQIAELKKNFALYEPVEEGYFYQSVKDLPGGPQHSYGLFSSLKILVTKKAKKVYSQQERPPYPIAVERPTLEDIMINIGTPDVFFFGTFYFTGVLLAFAVTRNFSNLYTRLTYYKAISRGFTSIGFGGMFIVPYYRLVGFWDNGLRWRFPEKQLDRADFMSEYLKNSIMKNFYQKA